MPLAGKLVRFNPLKILSENLLIYQNFKVLDSVESTVAIFGFYGFLEGIVHLGASRTKFRINLDIKTFTAADPVGQFCETSVFSKPFNVDVPQFNRLFFQIENF